MEKKACTKCGVRKVLEAFPKKKECPDGRRTICNLCEGKRKSLYIRTHPEYRRKKLEAKYRWEKTPKGRATRLRYQRAHAERKKLLVTVMQGILTKIFQHG